MSGWRQARAIALLPGTAAVVLPTLILLTGDAPDVGWGLDGVGAAVVAALGAVLMAAGFAVWLWTVLLFQRIGRGTLAPWDAPSRLVIAGPYRHMRNPMITAVATGLVGEAVFFGSTAIGVWSALFMAINHAHFLLFEEPGLERRFGEEYRAYAGSVPRWLPRRTPWAPG